MPSTVNFEVYVHKLNSGPVLYFMHLGMNGWESDLQTADCKCIHGAFKDKSKKQMKSKTYSSQMLKNVKMRLSLHEVLYM